MNLRPMTAEERKYGYNQSTQLTGQTGCIGYLSGTEIKSASSAGMAGPWSGPAATSTSTTWRSGPIPTRNSTTSASSPS